MSCVWVQFVWSEFYAGFVFLVYTSSIGLEGLGEEFPISARFRARV